jgi:hypothetical protein
MRKTYIVIKCSLSKNAHTAKAQYRNSKQIFPEKELRGLIPNFHIHVSVSDLYCQDRSAFCCKKICGPILGIYKALTDT